MPFIPRTSLNEGDFTEYCQPPRKPPGAFSGANVSGRAGRRFRLPSGRSPI
ncbi:MAG: hypothetical protein OXU61_04810 [Gammaproteobacteria bacterium]|nr:hypothetical protein [Gammaproteobacteria bacterium]